MSTTEQKPYTQLSVTGFPGASRTALWLHAPAVLKVAAAVFVTALAAQIEIRLPSSPVPQTLQTLAVLLVGFALGWRLAPAAMVAYLAVGAAGLKVFAPGSAGLAGPTAGYLMGFVLAAPFVGYVGRIDGWLRSSAAALGGTALVFACGLPWLSLYLGLSFERTVQLGLFPFLLDAGLKIAVAVAAVQACRYSRRRLARG